MTENKDIGILVAEFLAGQEGEGAILVHKKMHKNGSGEFACLRGLREDCSQVVNCPQCYHTDSGSYCMNDAQSVLGLLAVEEKHRKLIELGAPGAYLSIARVVKSSAYR